MTISMEEMQRMKEDDEVLGMFGEGEKFFLSKL